MTNLTIRSILFATTSLVSTNLLASYKVAVIESTAGAKEIKQGQYTQSIKRLNSQLPTANGESAAEIYVNLCVAYLSNLQFHQANKICDKAVSNVANLPSYKSGRRQVLASALNNRAVYKIKIDDYEGALKDFQQALKLHPLPLVEANIAKLHQHIHQESKLAQF
jgi:tetratricopeptide (TPR) repeat protein